MASPTTMPDPNVATRLEFTAFLLSQPCPDTASPTDAGLHASLRHLCDLLGHHPAMAVNNTQTYNTPAASKNKVYFMWDFMTRTLAMLDAIPDPAQPQRVRSAWEDVTGRTMMGVGLIKDTTGTLEMMNRQVGYNNDGRIEFGPEVVQAADAVAQALGGSK